MRVRFRAAHESSEVRAALALGWRIVSRSCGNHAKSAALGNHLRRAMLSQRAFSFEQSRMRVIKTAVERMRREVAQIFFVQFAEGLND